MSALRVLPLLACTALLFGCPAAAPPQSQFPTADAAIARLHETQACGTGVHASAKIDVFGNQGRVRLGMLLFASSPSNLRLDAMSPFGLALANLTSNGKRFALADLREKRFYVGPAEACNIARLTQVSIPGHALVSLLRGDAPVVKHSSGTIAWRSGRYVVQLPGTNDATEEVLLGVHPDDRDKPFAQQRVRLLGVTVRQYDGVLYRATLDGHAAAKMSTPREDPDGLPGDIAAPLPVSGPECHAELPRDVHVEVPASKSDILLRYDDVAWNPPLPDGVFDQENPGGLARTEVTCLR